MIWDASLCFQSDVISILMIDCSKNPQYTISSFQLNSGEQDEMSSVRVALKWKESHAIIPPYTATSPEYFFMHILGYLSPDVKIWLFFFLHPLVAIYVYSVTIIADARQPDKMDLWKNWQRQSIMFLPTVLCTPGSFWIRIRVKKGETQGYLQRFQFPIALQIWKDYESKIGF